MIYVLHYKDGEQFPKLPGYVHLLSGKESYGNESEIEGDNSGEHISHKNSYYSELTGIYWIYKNQDSDIAGVCHYRRFFTNKGEPLAYKLKRLLYYFVGMNYGRHGLIYTANKNYWSDRILKIDEAVEILNNYDVILPFPRKLRQSIVNHYDKYHDISDILLLKNIIGEKSPEYSESFEATLQQKKLYANNMIVMKRERFNSLCQWLFSILFEFENQVKLNNYTDYQQRIFGFLSERLITTWINHNQLKAKELPLIYFKYLKKL